MSITEMLKKYLDDLPKKSFDFSERIRGGFSKARFVHLANETARTFFQI